MNKIQRATMAVTTMFLILGSALAAPTDDSETSESTSSGTTVKVEKAVERGGNAAGRGVKHVVESAANGVKRGAKVAAKGIERGAKATGNAVGRATKKVGIPSSSSSDTSE